MTCSRECALPKIGLFSRAGKLWMCPNCSRVYVLDVVYGDVGDFWLRWRFAGFLLTSQERTSA